MAPNSDDLTPDRPSPGLADPRIDHHGPEILGTGYDGESGSNPDDASAVGPSGREAAEAEPEEIGGLIDPRSEIPGPPSA